MEGHDRFETTSRAQREDLSVAGQGFVIELSGLGFEPSPFHRQPERVATNGCGPVEGRFGVRPEVAGHTAAFDLARALPVQPIVAGSPTPL